MKHVKVKLKDKKLQTKWGKIFEEEVNKMFPELQAFFCSKCNLWTLPYCGCKNELETMAFAE
jgi:hypothetical protein